MRKLRVASCQFPVTADVGRNACYILSFMKKAVEAGADILHTSEGCLSGYAGPDFATFDDYDWNRLREHTRRLREEAARHGIWLVLGSAHFLSPRTKPANCLYLIDPRGSIVDRYDKSMCTTGDQKHYSAGNRLVTRTINGITVGLAICYDVCFPQIYAGYRQKGATLVLHSFYNARSKGKNCLDVLNLRALPTRCADNRMWAVANNSSNPYSHFGCFVARPDATIAQQLPMNRAGMLVHDFPDGLSKGGWIHNLMPLRLPPGVPMHFGKPSTHTRQSNGCSEP
jgi:deaminated glutathione amidase